MGNILDELKKLNLISEETVKKTKQKKYQDELQKIRQENIKKSQINKERKEKEDQENIQAYIND